MQTAKQEVEAMLKILPDDVTFEDLQYKLYVLEKIRNGLDDLDQNGAVTQDHAKLKMAKWLND